MLSVIQDSFGHGIQYASGAVDVDGARIAIIRRLWQSLQVYHGVDDRDLIH